MGSPRDAAILEAVTQALARQASQRLGIRDAVLVEFLPGTNCAREESQPPPGSAGPVTGSLR